MKKTFIGTTMPGDLDTKTSNTRKKKRLRVDE